MTGEQLRGRGIGKERKMKMALDDKLGEVKDIWP